MTWTPSRHAEHKRTLAMLKRCAGNGDEGPIGFRETANLIPVGWTRPGHAVVSSTMNEFIHRFDAFSNCRTLRPEPRCSCGLLTLEWRECIAIAGRRFKHLMPSARSEFRPLTMGSIVECTTSYPAEICSCGRYELGWLAEGERASLTPGSNYPPGGDLA